MRLNIGADTNLLFSGLYYGKTAGKIVELVRFNRVEFYQSEYLRDELLLVSRRNAMPAFVLEKFYSLDNVRVITDDSYHSKQEFESAKKIVRDPKDIPVYVFAKKLLSLQKIDYFVSGDSDLLQEKVRASLANKIVSVREFNEIISEQD